LDAVLHKLSNVGQKYLQKRIEPVSYADRGILSNDKIPPCSVRREEE
jgi:hypothetical protein